MASQQRIARTPIYLERGTRRIFACALDWPGWCRSGRTKDLAIAMLAGYAGRYAAVAASAGLKFDPEVFACGGSDAFEVVESMLGGTSTNFAPGEVPAADTKPVDLASAVRQAAVVSAAWRSLDLAVAQAPALPPGHRGRGRDPYAILEHILAAEAAYARRIGVRHAPPTVDDHPAIAVMRTEILAVLSAPSDGSLVVPTGWPTRYAARRIAWHALDHAWEIQDRVG
jgi:hypothetical protein